MLLNILNHFKKYIEIDSKDETNILSFFKEKTINKKEFLLEQNKKCNSHYFVLKGCLRMFFIDEKGTEQTVQFAIENWWITDYLAFESKENTSFTIQSIEKSIVLKIDYHDQEELLKKFPQFERYFRLIYQKAYGALQLRSKFLSDFSREQFYHHFNNQFPEFTNRVPQRMLASYLNMTPEYLSEIKNKTRS
ncbi:Crp/Fnr family transcriptional regulator [Chishuiella sp.]|uniref:Crp/Fnr family transcriptional regulator n=1 Tax=Chishuiella sp. TaxID=1969467 RepID=UPI0028B26217|nr:Crp/Fnr family transcriptional regulator [Chishuiella sp.]